MVKPEPLSWHYDIANVSDPNNIIVLAQAPTLTDLRPLMLSADVTTAIEAGHIVQIRKVED